MGATYLFSCPACGYAAEVSGGPDVGFFAGTTTIHCRDCRALYDVAVSQRAWDPDDKPAEPTCPKSERHAVEPWEHPGACPHCGGTMDRGDLVLLWD